MEATSGTRRKAPVPDEPKRLMTQPKEESMKPLADLDYTQQRWELESLRLGREATSMENFEGFVQEEEFKKIDNLEALLAPLTAEALDDYVKRNPCEAPGNAAYLRSFYVKLASRRARNMLAREMIDRGAEPTWEA